MYELKVALGRPTRWQ